MRYLLIVLAFAFLLSVPDVSAQQRPMTGVRPKNSPLASQEDQDGPAGMPLKARNPTVGATRTVDSSAARQRMIARRTVQPSPSVLSASAQEEILKNVASRFESNSRSAHSPMQAYGKRGGSAKQTAISVDIDRYERMKEFVGVELNKKNGQIDYQVESASRLSGRAPYQKLRDPNSKRTVEDLIKVSGVSMEAIAEAAKAQGRDLQQMIDFSKGIRDRIAAIETKNPIYKLEQDANSYAMAPGNMGDAMPAHIKLAKDIDILYSEQNRVSKAVGDAIKEANKRVSDRDVQALDQRLATLNAQFQEAEKDLNIFQRGVRAITGGKVLPSRPVDVANEGDLASAGAGTGAQAVQSPRRQRSPSVEVFVQVD